MLNIYIYNWCVAIFQKLLHIFIYNFEQRRKDRVVCYTLLQPPNPIIKRMNITKTASDVYTVLLSLENISTWLPCSCPGSTASAYAPLT